MASRIREYQSARDKVESAVAHLIARARNFNNDVDECRVRTLLSAAREYGRALNRLETMRNRK